MWKRKKIKPALDVCWWKQSFCGNGTKGVSQIADVHSLGFPVDRHPRGRTCHTSAVGKNVWCQQRLTLNGHAKLICAPSLGDGTPWAKAGAHWQGAMHRQFVLCYISVVTENKWLLLYSCQANAFRGHQREGGKKRRTTIKKKIGQICVISDTVTIRVVSE